VALDPRLASVELLALAALRMKQRQGVQDDPYPVTWLEGLPGDPPPDDLRPGGIYLPRKCATVEEWYQSVAHFRVPEPTPAPRP
jgi:hypothetical protein